MEKQNLHTANYTPIPCEYLDYIEHWATLREECNIIYIENTIQKETKGIIKDWFSHEKAEFLKMDSGLVIRLDQIISINDLVASKFSC